MTALQLKNHDGVLTENYHEAADVLGDCFKSVFVDEDTSTSPCLYKRTNECMVDIPFTEYTVCKKLQRIHPNKALGTDGLHPWILEDCSNSLVKPMYWIFRQSLDTGEVHQTGNKP